MSEGRISTYFLIFLVCFLHCIPGVAGKVRVEKIRGTVEVIYGGKVKKIHSELPVREGTIIRVLPSSTASVRTDYASVDLSSGAVFGIQRQKIKGSPPILILYYGHAKISVTKGARGSKYVHIRGASTRMKASKGAYLLHVGRSEDEISLHIARGNKDEDYPSIESAKMLSHMKSSAFVQLAAVDGLIEIKPVKSKKITLEALDLVKVYGSKSGSFPSRTTMGELKIVSERLNLNK